jgi:hypothetical protein
MRPSKSIAIVSVFLLVPGCSSAQVHPAPDAPNAAGQVIMEYQLVRDTVRSFLSAWLIERATEKAVLFFGNEAFQNEAILAASCASYIKPEERSSEKARRAGVNKFLRDFAPSERKTSLSEVLNREAIVPLVAQMGSKVINDPKVDLFVVVKLAREELPVEESKDANYLRKHLPARFYASFVPVGDGMVYFLWVPEGKTWKIYHASLVCM